MSFPPWYLSNDFRSVITVGPDSNPAELYIKYIFFTKFLGRISVGYDNGATDCYNASIYIMYEPKNLL